MADSRTQLSVELLCSDLIDGLDKSAAKVEEFSGRGTKAMNELSTQAKNMGSATKRVYDVLAKDMKKHEDAIRSLIPEYERLRQKQKSGEKMTRDELARLQQLSREYKNHAGAIATCAKEAETLAKKFKNVKSAETQLRSVTPQLTHSFVNLALAIEGTKVALEAALGAIKAFGLEQEQQVAQLDALTRSTAGAYESYRLLNDTWRNTNWNQATVAGMSKSFVALGLSAKEAAGLISTIGDAAAGLGVGENGGQQIADMLAKILATGEFSPKDMKNWQKLGFDIGQIFGDAFNMSAQEAMQAIKDGRVSGGDAFKILQSNMAGEFDGAMAKSKDNVLDALGDIQGNVETAAGEIGAALIRAFGIGDIAKDVVDVTEKIVQAARGINDTGKVWQSMANAFGEKEANGIESAFDALSGGATGVALAKIIYDLNKIKDEVTNIPGIDIASEAVKDIRTFESELSKMAGGGTEFAKNIAKMQKSLDFDKISKMFDQKSVRDLAAYDSELGKIIDEYDKLNQLKNFHDQQKKMLEGIRDANGGALFKAADKGDAEAFSRYCDLLGKATGEFNKSNEAAAAAADTVGRFADRVKQIDSTTLHKFALAQEGVIVTSQTMNAALVEQVGVWKLAQAATWGEVKALAATQLASAKAAFSLTALKATAIAAFKAIAIAIAQFMLTPLGLAITALGVLGAAVGYAYSKWKQHDREIKQPVENLKAMKDLAKIDFEINTGDTSANTAKLEQFRNSMRGVVEDSSRLATDTDKLIEKAKEYGIQLDAGAISQKEYAARMEGVYKEAKKLREELAKRIGQNLSDKELLAMTAALNKTRITADNLSDSFETLEKIANRIQIGNLKEQVEDGKKELDALSNKILELRDQLENCSDVETYKNLTKQIVDAEAEYDNIKKKVEELERTESYFRDVVRQLKEEQLELNDQYKQGALSAEEYKQKTDELAQRAEEAKGNILLVSSAVDSASAAMADGIITAQEYARVLASVANATAKIQAGQKKLADAMISGDSDAAATAKSEIASAAAEIAYEKDMISQLRDHERQYGQKPGQIDTGGYKLSPKKDEKKTGGGGGSKNTDDKDALALMKANQEHAKYELELAQKTAEAKKANEVELAKSLQNLYSQTGAKHAEIEQKRVVAQKQTELELLKLHDSYAKQRLAAEQSLETKEYELSKADTEKKKQAVQKQIADIKKSIEDMNKNEETDAVAIKLKADVNEFSQDLANKINDAMKNIQWAKDGVFGSLMKNAEQEFETAAQNIASKYDELLNRLTKARQNADMAEMMAVMDGFKASGDALNEAGNIFTSSQLLGVSEGDLATKAEAISSLYQVISQAMTTAASQEIAANNAAKESAEEHARSIKSLQDWGKSYLSGVGKEMGNAFAAWVTGAKSAKEAFGEMLQELIKNCITLLAQWAAVYALLIACGTNPHDASRGASKMVLGIDAKKNGGYISGPGGPRDDKAGVFALSDGEYVINAHAVDAIGKGNLDYMNSTGRIPTGNGSGGGTTSNGFYNGGGDTINVTVSALDAQSVESWLLGSGLSQIKQAFKNDQRNFNASYGVF